MQRKYDVHDYSSLKPSIYLFVWSLHISQIIYTIFHILLAVLVIITDVNTLLLISQS